MFIIYEHILKVHLKSGLVPNVIYAPSEIKRQESCHDL